MAYNKRTSAWLSTIRDEQLALAKKMCESVAGGLKANSGSDSGEEPDAAEGTPKTMASAIRGIMVEVLVSSLEQEFQAAICGYTDWLASSIVRSKRFDSMPVKIPSKRALAAICRKYGTKPGYLEYTIVRLSQESRIPLLGSVENGILKPDKKTLMRWGRLFDWS